jgi:hypothetical protein
MKIKIHAFNFMGPLELLRTWSTPIFIDFLLAVLWEMLLTVLMFLRISEKDLQWSLRFSEKFLEQQ